MALQTISLKGKEYVPVNVRIQEFRANDKYKNWSLISKLVEHTESICVFLAEIHDENDKCVATGYAKEYKSTSNPKYIENCETSAWGRALANLGIGIDESIASYQEMQSYTQASTPKPVVSMQEDESSSTPLTAENDDPKMCEVCGSEMKFRSGTSKAGKPYKAFFCESGEKTHTLFVN